MFVPFLALSTIFYLRVCALRLSGGLYCTELIAFLSAISSVNSLSKCFVELLVPFLLFISVAFPARFLSKYTDCLGNSPFLFVT